MTPAKLDANALNFSAGPGALPQPVLDETRQAIAAVPGVGLSVLGISHRSDWFAAVVAEAEANLRALLGLPDDFAVLFLQGGATLQFSMVPMLLLRASDRPAEYLRTGYWSAKAIPEAEKEGPVRVLWDGAGDGFRRLPGPRELAPAADAAYFHYVSNETVEGVQFHHVPGRDDVLRVCDMSSDFLSRPIDPARFDLIYAHAQKNLGPAGVTVALVRRELLERNPDGLPAMLDYRNHLAANSIYNTPPVFAIYVLLLVTRWLRDTVGGLAAMAATNAAKAATLYAAIDASEGFYRGRAAHQDRSLMNVVLDLGDPARDAAFLRAAETAGFSGLAGHRSLGGIRASIYNGMTQAAVDALRGFMEEFRRHPG